MYELAVKMGAMFEIRFSKTFQSEQTFAQMIMLDVALLTEDGVTVMAMPPSCTDLNSSMHRATSGGMMTSSPTGNRFIRSEITLTREARSPSDSRI